MISTTVFGPINSRRFGTSLGVDLSPNLKQCNFDCLYCELGKDVKKVNTQIDPIISSKILIEIEDGLKRFENIDVLTFTANGEPTLYPDLDSLMIRVNRIKNKFNIKTLILSNSGNIWMPDMRNTLLKFDKVKLSLDCASQKCFEKIDRPLKNINIEDIKAGILDFSKVFKGELFIEILFLEGVNTKYEDIVELNKFLLEVNNIVRIDIGTVERPPAYEVRPVSYSSLFEISKIFDKSLPIFIAKHQEKQARKDKLLKSEILHNLKLRPLTNYDMESLFDDETNYNLAELIRESLVEIKKVGSIEFYQPSKSLRDEYI